MAGNTEIICLCIWALNIYLQINEPAGSLGSESHFYVTAKVEIISFEEPKDGSLCKYLSSLYFKKPRH